MDLLLLAPAYETWWSLSLANERDDYVDRLTTCCDAID